MDIVSRLIDDLSTSPSGWFLLLCVVVLVAMQVLGPLRRRRRSAPDGRRSKRRWWRHDAADPLQQMDFISRVGFETWPLLNREEYPVLLALEEAVQGVGGGMRVMAQTSLGELIRPVGGEKRNRDLAFASVNSKRLDFAVVDRTGMAVLAVEYQGSGHYRDKSFIRDAVKREALRKAGVPLLEVTERFDADELREQVRRILIGGETGARREPTLSLSAQRDGPWQRGRRPATPAAVPPPTAPTPPTPPAASPPSTLSARR